MEVGVGVGVGVWVGVGVGVGVGAATAAGLYVSEWMVEWIHFSDAVLLRQYTRMMWRCAAQVH